MRLLPVLLTPRIIQIKNRWTRPGRTRTKEIVSLMASAAMGIAIYYSTLSALHDTEAMFAGVIDPSIPLTMILTTLFLMLTLSSSVTAIGALFLSRDLDIVLTAPIRRRSFLFGKICEVVLASGWMLLVFALPTVLAFGSFFRGGWLFIVFGPLLTLSLLLLPAILAVFLATLFGALVPPNRGRELMIVLFMGSLALFFFFLGAPAQATDAASFSSSLTRFRNVSSIIHFDWSPPTLCAEALRGLLEGDTRGVVSASLLFLALGLAGACIALLSLEVTYERAYSRAQSAKSTFRINSKLSQHITRLCLPGMHPHHRAIIAKEFKVFSRDISHTVQLSMLLGICFIYMYNFHALRRPDNLAPEFIEWWQAFLMLCNVALSSMVVASICTRFVFPSVSLEGPAFWVLQSAPLSARDILRTKFRAWFVPLSLIGSVVFISGAMALNADGPLVIATCIGGVILSYGLVGVSIGLGAVFSQFDWEYSAQVSTTLGTFVLMFASVIVLALDMIPLGLMFAAHIVLTGNSIEGASDWSAILSCLGTLFLMNKLLAGLSLSLGARALSVR
jgi:ABC-2 type transport system permease protein